MNGVFSLLVIQISWTGLPVLHYLLWSASVPHTYKCRLHLTPILIFYLITKLFSNLPSFLFFWHIQFTFSSDSGKWELPHNTKFTFYKFFFFLVNTYNSKKKFDLTSRVGESSVQIITSIYSYYNYRKLILQPLLTTPKSFIFLCTKTLKLHRQSR